MIGRDERIPSGCAIAGFIHEDGRQENGQRIMKAIANMRERSNGLGGGFAAYGIYPAYASFYALHMMFMSQQAKEDTEAFLQNRLRIVESEKIPTRTVPGIDNPPILWRYFAEVWPHQTLQTDEEEFMTRTVISINTEIPGAFVASSGKNMGVFKAVGYPEDVGEFYRLEDYHGYMWTAHGRFPTNTPGWWGGAHPFSIVDWSVVHNGEISSYGINYRYLEEQGYRCSLMTDTEVILYAFDLLVRKHGLPLDLAIKVVAAPFWKDIDNLADEEERRLLMALRTTYGSLLLNGPFSILLTRTGQMIGVSDRIKLRPLMAARQGETVYMATEEAAIRTICTPDSLWTVRGGEAVVGMLKGEEAYAIAG